MNEMEFTIVPLPKADSGDGVKHVAIEIISDVVPTDETIKKLLTSYAQQADKSQSLFAILVKNTDGEYIVKYKSAGKHIRQVLDDFRLKPKEVVWSYWNTKYAKKKKDKLPKRSEMQKEGYDIFNSDEAYATKADKSKLVSIVGKVHGGEAASFQAKKGKNAGKFFHKADFSLVMDGDVIALTHFGLEEADVTKANSVLTPGTYVRAIGKMSHNNYSNSDEFDALYVETLDYKEVGFKDHSQADGRVELSLHTKMSQLESIVNAQEAVGKAADIGLSGLTFTDTSAVQSYDVLMHNQNKYKNLDLHYGVQLDMVPERPQFVISPNDIDIDTATVIAFDIETTGFSAKFDDVIQLSASKMVVSRGERPANKRKNAEMVPFEEMEVVDEFDTYVHTSKQLSDKIKNLTHIEQHQVSSENAPTIEEALTQFLDWIDESKNVVLVGQNVTFDNDFLGQKLKELGKPKLSDKYEIFDTLPMAHRQAKRSRGYNLTAIARRLGLKLDHAHNSSYDARMTGEVFLKLIRSLEEQYTEKLGHEVKIKNGFDLQELEPDKDAYDETQFTKPIDVIALNQAGIKDIYELVSIAHVKHFYYRAKVYLNELKKLHDSGDIIVGSGDANGPLTRAVLDKSYEDALKVAKEYEFDYIEIMSPSTLGYETGKRSLEYQYYLDSMISIANEIGAIPVISGDVHQLDDTDEDNMLLDVLINSDLAIGDRYDVHPNASLKSADQLKEELDLYVTDPQLLQDLVVDNTRKVVKDATPKDVEPIHEKLTAPRMDGADEELETTAWKRAHELYGEKLDPVIEERIEREARSIIDNGYSVVYLTAKKLIDMSLDKDYTVGSRGSVGGSLVAFLIGITEVNAMPPHYRSKHGDYFEWVDPKKYNSGYDLPDKEDPNHPGELLLGDGHGLSFEVFTGVGGVKVPDIDLNFASTIQNEAQTWMKIIFGEDRVYRVGTISTVAEKTAFAKISSYAEQRDLDIPASRKQLLAEKLQGVKSNTGQHPAGIVTIPQGYDVTDFTPYTYPANKTDAEWMTTHFPKDILHDSLLKMDILGHDDPAILHDLDQMTGVDPRDITQHDIKDVVTHVFGQGSTARGMPEFGTPFARQMIDDAHPKYFSDLIQLSGLSHGKEIWVGNAKDLIDDGVATLQTVIGTRDKIINDLMTRGVSLKDAYDVVGIVKSGGKKPFSDKYIDMIRATGLPEWYINSIRRITYIFPAAHAAAYVLSGVRFGYYKMHFPAEFYAAILTYRSGDKSLAPFKDLDDVEWLTDGKGPIKMGKDSEGRHISNISETVVGKKMAQLRATTSDKDLTYIELMFEAIKRNIRIHDVDFRYSKANSWNLVYDENNNAHIYAPFTSVQRFGGAAAELFEVGRDEAVKNGTYKTPKTAAAVKAYAIKPDTGKSAVNKGVIDGLIQVGMLQPEVDKKTYLIYTKVLRDQAKTDEQKKAMLNKLDSVFESDERPIGETALIKLAQKGVLELDDTAKARVLEYRKAVEETN